MAKKYVAVIIFALSIVASIIIAVVNREKTTIRFGLYDNPPLSFVDENGRPQGFIVDVLKGIADEQKWGISYEPCEFSECLTMLNEGKIDLLAPVLYTDDRAREFDFSSEPLFINWAQVYVPQDSSIEVFSDLQGKTIVYRDGDIYAQSLEAMLPSFGVHANWIFVEDREKVFSYIRDGKADAGVVDRIYGQIYDREYGLRGTTIVFEPLEVLFASGKGRHAEILASIDASIKEMKRNPASAYTTAMDQWLGREPYLAHPAWVRWVELVILASLAFFILASFMLRYEVNRKTQQLQEEIAERELAEIKLKQYTEHLEDLVAARTQELRDALDQVVRQEKLAVLGQLVTGIGQMIHNPLTIINNASYYLEANAMDEKGKEYTEIIRREVQDLASEIERFLAYAKPRTPQKQRITVGGLVRRALNKVHFSEKVEQKIEIPDTLPPLAVDGEQIEQALIALLNNASDAMPHGGVLTIRAEQSDDTKGFVCLHVRDTGEGISAENKLAVFEPLFTTRKRRVGLGLGLCKQFVEANGGIITFESEEGQGSVFTLRLPAFVANHHSGNGKGN